MGAMRGIGENAKSVATAKGSPAQLRALGEGWYTEYIRASCADKRSEPAHVLGIEFDGLAATSLQFDEIANTVADLHEAISHVEATATELVLLRKCADVCKVVHLLRAAEAKR